MITALAALAFGLVGAVTGVMSLVQQRGRDLADERERAASRAQTVTARWITRELTAPNSLGRTKEWGLRVQNHGRVPVHSGKINASARGDACDLPVLDPLQSGEMFIRKNSPGPNSQFDVRRMGANVVSTEAVLTPSWRVDRIDFVLHGRRETWEATGTRHS